MRLVGRLRDEQPSVNQLDSRASRNLQPAEAGFDKLFEADLLLLDETLPWRLAMHKQIHGRAHLSFDKTP